MLGLFQKMSLGKYEMELSYGGERRTIMPTFKDKELETLSQQILGRAVRQQQPLPNGGLKRVSLRQKPQLPRLLRQRL